MTTESAETAPGPRKDKKEDYKGVLMTMARAFIDKGLEKVLSRKLLVWATATGLAATGFLTSADWVLISALYIGGQSVIDAVVQLKGA